MIVVGLGTQDTLSEAEDFTQEYGTQSFSMLWDESYETWDALGITSQPSAVLIAADGTPITSWFGAFPQDEVLKLAAESQTS